MSMDRAKDESPPRDGSPTSHGTDVLDGLRVLYAEDHPAMQRAVGRLLTAAGASVTIAKDGLEATEAALATPLRPDSDGPAHAAHEWLRSCSRFAHRRLPRGARRCYRRCVPRGPRKWSR